MYSSTCAHSFKVLLIAQSEHDVPFLCDYLKTCNSADINIFSMTHTASFALEQKGMDFFSYKDLDLNDFETFKLKESNRLAKEWCRIFGFDEFFIEKGIPLAELVERDFSLYFRSIFEITNMLLAALERVKPEMIVMPVDLNPYVSGIRVDRKERIAAQVALSVANAKGIRLMALETNESLVRPRFDLIFLIKDAITYLFEIFSRLTLRKVEHKPTILFSGGVQQLQTVIDEAVLRKSYSIFILRDTWSWKHFIQFYRVRIKFMAIPFSPDFKKNTRLFFKSRVKGDEKKISERAVIVYRDMHLNDVVLPRVRFLVNEYFPRLRRLVVKFSSLLSSGIRAVIVDEDVCDFNKTLVRVAQVMGIPSLVVQHGAHCLPQGFVPISATRMAVWGRLSLERFVKWGESQSRLVITGVPKYDRLIKREVNTKFGNDLYKKMGFDRRKKTILVCPGISATNSFEKYVPNVSCFEENIEMIQATLHAVENDSSYQVIVKLHERDRDESVIRRVIENFKNVDCFVLKSCDTITLIEVCDLLIASYSSVVLEAMLLNKPVITTNFSGLPDLMPYVEAGGALGVYEKEKIKEAITAILSDDAVRQKFNEGRRLFLERCIYKVDGRASKRVVDLMEELICSR